MASTGFALRLALAGGAGIADLDLAAGEAGVGATVGAGAEAGDLVGVGPVSDSGDGTRSGLIPGGAGLRRGMALMDPSTTIISTIIPIPEITRQTIIQIPLHKRKINTTKEIPMAIG